MKVSNVLALLPFASQALGAPSFLSAFENDAKSLSNRHRGGESIIDKLRECKDFSMFVKVLERESGLRDELDGSKDVTVFAPNNAAMKNWEREHGQVLDDESSDKLRDVLRYHVAMNAQLSRKDMHAGALIPTSLRLKTLGDRHQRVRVMRFADTVLLNGMAATVGEEIEAGRGVIHAISRVLVPPPAVPDAINQMPTHFSTFALAMERTGMACDLMREKALTAFAPNNHAWTSLGVENLRYLFSCAGQETWTDRRGMGGSEREVCKGVETLKQIVQNHIATDLAYSTDIIRKERMTLKTLGKTDICVCAVEKGAQHKRSSSGRDRDDEDKHADVRKYNFVINKGESRISFTDGLAANGAVQVIDNVIIGDVRLPFDSNCGNQMIPVNM